MGKKVMFLKQLSLVTVVKSSVVSYKHHRQTAILVILRPDRPRYSISTTLPLYDEAGVPYAAGRNLYWDDQP